MNVIGKAGVIIAWVVILIGIIIMGAGLLNAIKLTDKTKKLSDKTKQKHEGILGSALCGAIIIAIGVCFWSYWVNFI